jgi:hypothetical protein
LGLGYSRETRFLANQRIEQGKGSVHIMTFKEEWINREIAKNHPKFIMNDKTCNFCDRPTEYIIHTRNLLNEGEKVFTALSHNCFDCTAKIVAEFQSHGYEVRLEPIKTRVKVQFT